jgi:16S rRNA G966 N2-methylase RsmD
MENKEKEIGVNPSDDNSKKKRSTFLDIFFPGDVSKLQEGRNYTEETLAYMTPYGKAERLTATIVSIGASIIIDACAGIGGNTIGFASNNNIKHVFSYERDRQRWEMLHNNLSVYKLSNKCSAFNQDFELGEDLQLLNVDHEHPESDTIVYFDPPWLPPNASIDKSNYILSGIRLSGRSLEEWAKFLCHNKGYKGVIYHLPRDYRMILSGQLIDDKSDNKARLIYYSADPSVIQTLIFSLNLKQEEPIKPEKIEEKVSSHEEPLEMLPPPVQVKGPRTILQTFLTQNFPQKAYHRGGQNPKLIHSGQRKLLLSEIEFLTRMFANAKKREEKEEKKNYQVLYIGAAPGIHIPYLAEMFPEVKFILYDPARFEIKETNQIKIHQKLFTDDEVKNFIGVKNLLFISDIRSTPRQNYQAPDEADPEFEAEVSKNLEQQKKWVLQLQPLRSLLKFRLPFATNNEELSTSYFDGVIFFQCYAPSTSSETRLEVGPHPKELVYSHLKYEQQLFYFNTMYRNQSFFHYNRRYGWSYDTIREFFILKKYQEMRGRGNNEIPSYFEKFDRMTKDPSKKIAQILSRY